MARPEEKIGSLAPWQHLHITQVRVRYSETDQMGVVYYGRYAEYCEIGRTGWIRALGLPYAQMEKEWGVLLPVRSFQITYHAPARYDDLLTIYTWITEKPTSRITFGHAIYQEEGRSLFYWLKRRSCWSSLARRIGGPVVLHRPFMRLWLETPSSPR